MSRPLMARLAGLALSVFMPAAALAEVPSALDRVPADVPLMVSVPSVGGFVANLESFAKMLPGDALAGLDDLKDVLETPGVNKDGSAAVAVLDLNQPEGEEPPAVAIVPVKDYAAFAKHFGGTGTGVEEVTIDGTKNFIKSLDGGFAAVSEKKEALEKFAGKPGNGAAIEKLMGANGKLAAEGKDAVVIANLPVLAPKIKEGLEEAKENMKQMAQMGGGGEDAAAGNIAMMEWFGTGLTRDGQAGVLAFSMGEKGVTLDVAGQFKEGSEWASYFTGKGKGGALAGAMPNEAFLFAFAADTSSAGLRKMFTQLGELQKKAGGMMAGFNPLAMIDKTDAMGFFMGEAPSVMGGMLFMNSAIFVRSSDPAGYVKANREMVASFDGKTENGVTFSTTYKEGAETIGGRKVDSWQMRMKGDPNNPAGAQVAQMQAMIFGPQGLSGFVGQTDGGVVVTYARNKDIFEKAAASLAAGKGLNADPGVAMVGERLPKGRTMEGYIGVKSIMNTVGGFLAMMGGGAELNVPEDLPPIGFGGTTDQGGVRVAVIVPSEVIKSIAEVQKTMQGGGVEEEPMMEEEEEAGQPKF